MTERNIHAGIPFTDNDETIARALEDVSIPTLLLSMVHMTGDRVIGDFCRNHSGIHYFSRGTSPPRPTALFSHGSHQSAGNAWTGGRSANAAQQY
jgi:hypothetical protein